MPRKKSPTLTDAELHLMKILWKQGPKTVRKIFESQEREPPLSYSSLSTFLRILEEKGHVRHEKRNRSFVYYPVLGEREASQSAVDFVATRFFKSSPTLLALNILKEEGLDSQELERLEHLIGEGEEA